MRQLREHLRLRVAPRGALLGIQDSHVTSARPREIAAHGDVGVVKAAASRPPFFLPSGARSLKPSAARVAHVTREGVRTRSRTADARQNIVFVFADVSGIRCRTSQWAIAVALLRSRVGHRHMIRPGVRRARSGAIAGALVIETARRLEAPR
jgi:hypothetical protein